MREILFRGKRKDNSAWVEGDFCHPCNIVFVAIGYDEVLGQKDVPILHDYAVIPETVGQYTGITDKNGKKIFEGDIVSERPPMNAIAYIGYVAYDDELAVWRFIIKNDTKFNCVLLGSYSTSYTVIGNIHDNPEFLEVDN